MKVNLEVYLKMKGFGDKKPRIEQKRLKQQTNHFNTH